VLTVSRWEQLIPGAKGTCIDINAFYLANAALTITTDFITYTLPMPTLWSLQMPKQQKLALMGIFGLGGFAVLSSVIRITYVVPMLSSLDSTCTFCPPLPPTSSPQTASSTCSVINKELVGVIAEPMYWSVIETNIGILAISIPSYRPLIRRFFPKLLGSYPGGDTDPYANGHSDSCKVSRNASYGLRSFDPHDRAMGMDVVITGVGSKNESEEQILGAARIPEGKIMTTTNVTQSVAHNREASQ
jgi:hypothetical protein